MGNSRAWLLALAACSVRARASLSPWLQALAVLARLGKEVLEANIRNVITTLDGVAKDPETLALLVQLLQELLDDPTTRKNLLALVIDLIEAPFLRQALIA